MATFDRNPPDVVALLRETVETCHPELSEYRLKFSVLLKFAPDARPKKRKKGEPEQEPKPPAPPVRDRGAPAPATVKFANLEQRLQGRANVNLVIDGDNWKTLLPSRKAALLHHYTALIKVNTDGEGNATIEDDGYPKLQRRQYDYSVGIFVDVVSQHGEDALEVLALREAEGAVREILRGREPAAV